MRGCLGGKAGLAGSVMFVCIGDGRWLTGRRVGDTNAGVVGSGPNHWRIMCNIWQVASPSLHMSLSACLRAKTWSSSAAGWSSIISFGDIGAEWNSRLAGERGFSEVASAEAEESDGSP